MKVQNMLLTRLAISPAGKLFGITEKEFDLETGFVKTVNVRGRQEEVSGKEQGGM